MDQFCGTEFWNYNLIWNTDDPEITECFQKTVLVWVPCAFLWLFSGIEIYYFLNSKNKNIPYTWLFISKQILIITLILLNIVDLGIAIHKSTYEKVYNVDYCTPIIRIVTFLKTSILVTYNRKYGMRTSGLLFLFWFLLALCGIIEYRSLLKLYINKNEISYSFISYMIYYPIVIFLFLLNFLVDAEPKYSKYPRAEKPCPEQKSSFPGKIFFSWFDSMAWKGFKKPLEITDLWSINPEDTAKEIVPKFEKYWKKNSQKRNKVFWTYFSVQNTKASFRKGSGQVNFNNEYKKKTSSVLPPLCKAFGATFLFGAVLKFVQDIITFVSPQILQLLIDFIKGHEPLWKGYFYAVLLLITAIFQTLVLSQYFHRMFLVGLRIRTALIAAIYRKALRMSNAARKESTVGEIVNLMSVDAQRFMDLTAYINMIWSAPLQIVLALYFLWDILGPAVLAGLAVLLILIPINVLITNRVKTLQIRQMKHKDERVKLMNEVLNGIKVLKLYAWEPSFEEQILKIRTKEIKVLKETAYLNSGTSFIWSFAPFLVSLVSFATYVLIDENNRLDSTKAFVSLSLFNILRFPLSILPMMIGNMVQAYVSVKRINKFMNTEELDPNNVQHDSSESYTLLIENGTFIWDMENIDRPTLRNINLQVEQGQLVAVVGTVGSGKSSLLSALLGEMEKINGRVNTKGSIAYVSQQAWIQNASLQDNVLFGKSLHKNLYNRVIEACALTPDLKVLPAGDQTEIGEKGINLSGGQKQRVSLARAVYNDSDIYFLDDPLSAVDSHVGKHIFENVIGSSGLLKKKTRILVTHGITYLPEVDNIIVLKDGEITEVGTYKQLLEKRGAFSEFLVQHLQEVGNLHADGESEADLHEIKQHLESTIGSNELQQKLTRGKSRMSESQSESGSIADRKSLNGSLKRQYSTSSQQSGTYENSNIKEAKLLSPKSGGKLIEVEKTETGSVKWRVYSHYFKSIGWFLSISTIIMNAIFQGFSIGSNTWLSMWSDDNLTDVNNTVDHIKQNMYLGVYGGLGLGQGMTVLGGALFLAKGTIRASVHLFESTLQRVLRNPMSFFDQTPTGRILNRLSKDTDVIDNTLPSILRSWITCLFGVIATLVVISFSTPIFISVIIPISVIYYFVQRLYVASSRQLKRLESVSRSPIYSHFSETVSGAQMIRAFGVQERFINESESKVDFNQVCYYPSIIANRWLAVRLEMVGNLIIFFAALFAVLNKDTVSSGLVGLSVSYALQVTQTLNWLVRMTSDVETNIVAVERIKEYGETPQEASWKNPDYIPPKEWPVQGRVEFKDYKVRYREDLELVLRGLSFSIKGGEKVGIVGRTGAGKSSLTLALFRIIEAADGQIFIDDIDIAKLGLHDLRSRLTIIPQDPVLFSGSLRINLDPFNCYTDDEVWRALEHAHLKSFIKTLPNGLLYEVSEGGENLSIGQRQLICLARALLRKTKVLILDEATASVDLETDDLIQQTIRQEFKDCTILTIAHRLNTILDSDRIIVLDNGRIVEYDSPESLLRNSSSLFSSIAKDAGLAT
ncbi:multidrug resistance-associated protein 1 [Apis mellifera]|uniref:ABC-type glutathione-S-conjugate transporter n=1 Tax=Apis mellifera TaxID=7460 RepID=A0A7M7GLJ8_APIME|nr:multidrug resistance-associated protein 1 [Apis mellifera]XP_026295849.1 multidrug resistance-associated protein 1 [Apis mellifera]XP_026295850.1 multidrug resistance-associated protein 1 [Apis mellifera]XP_026295851.1 multidrug resistance-associated protein 1 [Apis mellifera]|eukprot:XP_006558751.1 multidrug resistance-associated protein 1 [Apis mellifera]